MSNSETYRSAISYGLFIPSVLLLLTAAVTAVYSGQLVPMLILGIVLSVVVVPIFLNTSYTLDGGILKVHCGLIVRKDIPVSSIKAVRLTDSILSSPALSVRERIELTYGKFDNVIISPERRAEFVADLLRLNPQVSVGDSVL